VDTERLVLSLS